MMIWHFINTKIVEEYDSGYVIELVRGTWVVPVEIKSTVPKNMEYFQQAKYSREGLQFARIKALEMMSDVG